MSTLAQMLWTKRSNTVLMILQMADSITATYGGDEILTLSPIVLTIL